jgi:hypothetical protein
MVVVANANVVAYNSNAAPGASELGKIQVLQNAV